MLGIKCTYNHEVVYCIYIIIYEANTIMIKYNNQLSFNIIVHNTIKYHRGNLSYRGEFSKTFEGENTVNHH